ncbi:MAG: hypothetical protein FJY95_06130 [Candidatus Handelsmanbacteria bacterium]|nr:hypothetical protein [Candidatus Handelsmanbacteria bacterium]
MAARGEMILRPGERGRLDLAGSLTVAAWVHSEEPRAEAMQVIAAQWALRGEMGGFATYDAAHTEGLNTRGYFGAVWDGRYVHFAPQYNGEERHGKVLRLDTCGDFYQRESWASYDAGYTSGLQSRGYYGAVFDGQYVYFVPRTDGVSHHSRVLRLDGRGEFRRPESWSAFDAGLPISYQSGAFDGRYIYFVPGYEEGKPTGVVLRLDTRGEFADPSSYAVYDAGNTGGMDTRCYDGAVFDGRYVYFAPLETHGNFLRLDTQGEYMDPASWAAFHPPLPAGQGVGAIFDGRYVYYVPYTNKVVVRCDTAGAFQDPGSWEAHDAGHTSGLKTRGYDGAAFDGRYVYFIPFWEGEDLAGGFHARLLRYDTGGAFGDPHSWQARDAGDTLPPNPGGFNGGAFDGRFLYLAPWREGTGPEGQILSHAKVMRCDTADPSSCFILKYMDCGHNGGLGAALGGPSLMVNTARGVRSARSFANPGPGWHHLAGVYEGERIALYLDGEKVAEGEGGGNLVESRMEVEIGGLDGGRSPFRGEISQVRIATAAWSPTQVREAYLQFHEKIER